MKIKNIIYSSIGTLATVLSFSFLNINTVSSSAGDNVFGHAWNDTIGWISFNNCTSTASSSCSGVDYGVNATNNNAGAYVFSGYAWNDNLGWISFEPSDSVGCSSYPGNSSPCTPRLIANPGMQGFAKILSLGSEGFVDLAGVNVISGGSGMFQGYAWNDKIGWIDFSGVGIQTATTPTVTITSNPSSVYANSNITLTWSSQNLTGYTCTASNSISSNQWTGTKATSGTATVNVGNNASSSRVYTITCTDGTTTVSSSATVSIFSGVIMPWFYISVPYPATFVEGGANVSFDVPLTVLGHPSSKNLYTSIGSNDPALSGATYELFYNGNPVPRAQPDPSLAPTFPLDMRFLSTNISGTFVIRVTIPINLAAGSGNHLVLVDSTDGAETHSTSFNITPIAQIPSGTCTLNGATQPGSGQISRSGSVSVVYNGAINQYLLSCTTGGGGNSVVHFTGGNPKVNGVNVTPSGLRLTAFPQVVDPNSTTLLRWEGKNVSNCRAYTGIGGSANIVPVGATPAWTGPKNISGSETVNIGSTAETFTLECADASGKIAKASTIVGIKGVDPGMFITGSPLTGKGGRLFWRFGTNILPAPFYKEE
jgi:hypothetical protein